MFQGLCRELGQVRYRCGHDVRRQHVTRQQFGAGYESGLVVLVVQRGQNVEMLVIYGEA